MSNLLYLLNGPSPLYVLYIAKTEELSYAWVRDEVNRIEKENPDWKQQDKVTLRFTKRLDETGLPEKAMTFRFRIGDMLAVIALVALFVGFFAPELRSWDRNTVVISVATGIITVVTLVSFTPVWVVLFMLRRRSRRGSGFRTKDYAAMVAAFLSGLGILVAIGFAIRWMVVR